MAKKQLLLLIALLGVALAVAARVFASAQRSGLDRTSARRLYLALRGAYGATLAAFEVTGTDQGFEERDARSAAAAQTLEEAFEASRGEIGERFLPIVTTVVESVRSAQVQIMAFAINRKNRGLPDAPQIDAEATDRHAFRRDVEPLLETLAKALG